MPVERGESLGAGSLLKPVLLTGAVLHQLGAAGDEIVEPGDLRIRNRRGDGAHGVTVIDEHESIDFIGLGELAASPGEVAHLAGVDDTHGDAGLVQGSDEGPVVGAGRFANDVDGVFGQELEQGSKAYRMVFDEIGQGEPRASDLEGVLGDIDTDQVDRVSNHGKTYPCKYELEPHAAW